MPPFSGIIRKEIILASPMPESRIETSEETGE
jgi:hypothetical protein